ncbi:MAG TPA: MFS transporter [Thermoanaerobaculia bacterium]|nr:MFS transporter [Thermoanaerobaculia bacterium]
MTEDEPRGRWRVLSLVAAAELLAMGLWFGVSAVAPAVAAEWEMGARAAAWLTMSVQLGFVAGTLLSAILNLADVFRTSHLFAVSAFLGAAANLGFVLFAGGAAEGIALRFLTGMFLAGVYPPGMKILATWFRRGRGMALGVLVGSLTLGKATPYLVNAIGSESWRANVMVASLGAVAGGALVMLFVTEGPFAAARARFDPRQVATILRDRGVRLANFGYFGHMWELYAMWTWLPVMLRASFEGRGEPGWLAEAGSFLVIGSGAAGCVIAGLLADRHGRTAVTSAAMAISGACCLVAGLLFGGPPALLLVVATIWGATVVADSAQFSACVTELGDPQYIGTALTLQTSIGFLLTTVSIAIVPMLVEAVGWRWAFAVLAPGPILGTMAMMRLRALPEAAKIAGGAR